MKCSNCGSLNVKVIDSHGYKEHTQVRRRRKCKVCGHRWTTLEISVGEMRPGKTFCKARKKSLTSLG